MNLKQLSMSLIPRIPKRTPCPDGLNWLDVSEIALGAGFSDRVAISASLSDALEELETEEDGDYDQRLFDVLWQTHFQVAMDQRPSATFTFTFPRKHWKTDELSDVSLRLHVERGNQAFFVGILKDF